MTSVIRKGKLREKLFKVSNPVHLPIVGMRKLMCRETGRHVQHHVIINLKGQEPRHSRSWFFPTAPLRVWQLDIAKPPSYGKCHPTHTTLFSWPQAPGVKSAFPVLPPVSAWELITASSRQEGTANFSLASAIGQSLHWNLELPEIQ